MNQQSFRAYLEKTNSSAIVFYVNYLKYIEKGRSEYREKYGII